MIARFSLDDEGTRPDEVLGRMAEVFAGWPQARGAWTELKLLKGNRHTIAQRWDGPLATEAMLAEARGRGEADEMLVAQSSFRCWRFGQGHPESGSVVIGIECCGADWRRLEHEDGRLGGNAALVVHDAGPFVALIDEGQADTKRAVNDKVRENLEALTGLLFRMIESLAPRSMKLYTDEGLYLPFNAHLAYFRNDEVVLEDLALIADAWENGLPHHHIAPLKDRRADDMGPALHHWRSPSQRDQLWQCLSAALGSHAEPTTQKGPGPVGQRRIRQLRHAHRFHRARVPRLPQFLHRALLPRGSVPGGVGQVPLLATFRIQKEIGR